MRDRSVEVSEHITRSMSTQYGRPPIMVDEATPGFAFDSSLALYLPLYELEGYHVRSGDQYGHLCTVTNALWTPQGRNFVGNGVIALPSDLFETDSLGTFAAWFKRAGIGVFDPIFTSTIPAGNSFLSFRANVNNFLQVSHLDLPLNDQVQGNTTLSAATWYLGFWQSDGTAWSLYVNDGAAETLSTIIGSNTGDWFADLVAGTHTVWVGKLQYAGGTNFLNGTLSEIWYFNKFFTPQERQNLYLATKWRYL